MMKYKYLVYAFYENLAKHKRITGYNSLREAIDYINGLIMCETPYMLIDYNSGKLMRYNCFELDREKMIKIFMDDEDTL